MSASLYITTSQLLALMQEECNDINPSTATRNRYLALLNQAHLEILDGGGKLNETRTGSQKTDARNFNFLGYDNVEFLQLEPATEADVSVTLDSTSASFATAQAASQAGKTIIIDGVRYSIASHTAGLTAFTLDSVCLSDTATYPAKWFKSEYNLPAYAWRVSADAYLESPVSNDPISIVSFDVFKQRRQYRDLAFGRPTLIGLKKSDKLLNTLVIDAVPTRRMRLTIYYTKSPQTLDLVSVNPILPPENRKMIAHLAAYYQLAKRDDTRAERNLADARSLFLAMVGNEDGEKRNQSLNVAGTVALFRPSISRRSGRVRW